MDFHQVPYALAQAKANDANKIPDPGNGKTLNISVDDGVCAIDVAASASETRLLPPASGFGLNHRATVIANTVGASGTCAIQGVSLTAAGDLLDCRVVESGSTKAWRVVAVANTAGTARASSALVLDSGKGATGLGALEATYFNATVGLRMPYVSVAAAGSSISDGGTLIEGVNFVTASNGTKGVCLPSLVNADSLAGGDLSQIVVVINSVASNNLKVYPNVDDNVSINYGSAQAAYTLAGQKHAIFFGTGGIALNGWFTDLTA